MPQNSHGSPVQTLVRSASRRRHGLLALEQFGYAVAMVLSGAIFMLVLGTQILDWYWLVLLAICGVTTGTVRLRGRLITNYQVAQTLDHRLQLSDTLSTAWFLLATPSRHSAQALLQIKQAEKLAESVEPQLAFPLQRQRAWTITALLLVIACGLFALRYLVEDRLTFQQALIPIHLGSFVEQLETKFITRDERSQDPRMRSVLHRNDASGRTPLEKDQPGERTGAKGTTSGANQDEQANNSRDLRQRDNQSGNNNRAAEAEREGRSRNNSANESNFPSEKRQQQRASANDRTDDNTKATEKERNSENSSPEPSLASKMRDALSGLMQKMHLGSRPARSGQEAGHSTSTKPNKNQMASDKAPQSSADDDADGKATNSDASSPQAQQARSSEKSSSSQSQGSDNSSGQRSSDAHSAAGHQNGSKSTKEAEQLKAMGKLAEIMGKRSNDVSGEMSVETFSGKQQLQTRYTQKMGQHSGLGGEINHNQVPLDDQQYVREYMKQVHKEANAQ